MTYLKVEPVQWSTYRLRRVLNAPISLAELAKATAEAEREEAPLMPSPLILAGNPATKDPQRTRSPSKQLNFSEEENGDLSTVTSRTTRDTAGQMSEGAAVPSSAEGVGTMAVDTSLREEGLLGGSEGDDLAAELAQHQADLDDAYVQMVLDLDNLWGGSEDGDGAVEAYESALAVASPGRRPRGLGAREGSSSAGGGLNKE